MTTRHTISHADELYRGNAFQDSYSPDGRRGVKMTHLYLHKFLTTAAAAPGSACQTAIFSSFPNCTLLTANTNWVSHATGGSVSAGSTVISFDVPRNVVLKVSGATGTALVKIHGRDVYGEQMAETVFVTDVSGGTVVSGRRAFKDIDKIYVTAAFSQAGTVLTMGTGNRLGLPFHLQTTDQICGVFSDGRSMPSGPSGATCPYVIDIGASFATTLSTSGRALDARGTIRFAAPWAPDGTIKLSALMEVDASTQRKAFGPPQVSSCTNG